MYDDASVRTTVPIPQHARLGTVPRSLVAEHAGLHVLRRDRSCPADYPHRAAVVALARPATRPAAAVVLGALVWGVSLGTVAGEKRGCCVKWSGDLHGDLTHRLPVSAPLFLHKERAQKVVRLRIFVTSFAEVVTFYAAWEKYAVPSRQYVPDLPPAWGGLPWRIEQNGDTAWCSIVLKD